MEKKKAPAKKPAPAPKPAAKSEEIGERESLEREKKEERKKTRRTTTTLFFFFLTPSPSRRSSLSHRTEPAEKKKAVKPPPPAPAKKAAASKPPPAPPAKKATPKPKAAAAAAKPALAARKRPPPTSPTTTPAAPLPPVTHPSHGTRAGDVFVFGTGDCGQFGRGEDVVEASRPIQSPLPTDDNDGTIPPALRRRALQVAPGGMHPLALAADGSVWSTGVNDEGALGRPTAGEVWDGKQEEEEEEEEEEGGEGGEKMEEGGDAAADADADAENPPAAKKAKKASSTSFDSAPHLPRGDPYSWGLVSFPEGAGPFVQVSAGDSHSCALAADGRVWAWGTFRDASGVFGFAPGGQRIARSPQCVYSAPKGASGAAARAV